MSEKHQIVPALLPLMVPIDSVVQNPENDRGHDASNLAAIQASLEDYGQDVPLVCREEDRVIIKGNGRHLAARALGWTHIAALFVPDSQLEAAGRSIADNRSGELSHWEKGYLQKHVQALVAQKKSPARLGFTPEQVAILLCQDAQGGQPGGGGGPGEGPQIEGAIPLPRTKSTMTLKVEGVSVQEARLVANLLNQALQKEGLPYRVKG